MFCMFLLRLDGISDLTPTFSKNFLKISVCCACARARVCVFVFVYLSLCLCIFMYGSLFKFPAEPLLILDPTWNCICNAKKQ